MSVTIRIDEDKVSTPSTATEVAQAATEQEQKVELKKFKITAVIPTVQYGNMQPEYEVEAATFEEAQEIALPYIESLWAKYCAKGSELKIKEPTAEAKAGQPTDLVVLQGTLTDSKAIYSDSLHKYWNSKTKKPQMGGSTFAHNYQKPFEKAAQLERMSAEFDIPADEIEKMWALKGEASNHFGTAVHAALEMYGKFNLNGQKTGAKKEVNSALHDNPLLQEIVEKFFKGRDKEDAVYEEFVNDDEKDLCGQADRILIVNRDKKILRVQDFKTNADINKKPFGKLLAPFNKTPDTPLNVFWLQLSFYAELFKKHGWTVEGLDVFHWDGKSREWVTYTHEGLDLSEVI